MSLYDLTGNRVSFTYGRLVQITSGSYYDGFGNLSGNNIAVELDIVNFDNSNK